QDGATARDLLAVEADAVGQAQPQLEPGLAGLVAVVIADAADPHPPAVRVLGLGTADPVLDGDPGLGGVGGWHPRAQLPAGQAPLVHQRVIAMVIVVSRFALAADPGDELIPREGRPERRRHTATSMPSWAISHPAASADLRSGPSSRRTGFVLLTWM